MTPIKFSLIPEVQVPKRKLPKIPSLKRKRNKKLLFIPHTEKHWGVRPLNLSTYGLQNQNKLTGKWSDPILTLALCFFDPLFNTSIRILWIYWLQLIGPVVDLYLNKVDILSSLWIYIYCQAIQEEWLLCILKLIIGYIRNIWYTLTINYT